MGRVPLNPSRIAALITLAGVASLIAGLALIYVPAAFVVGGAGLIALGLFGVDIE